MTLRSDDGLKRGSGLQQYTGLGSGELKSQEDTSVALEGSWVLGDGTAWVLGDGTDWVLGS